MINTKILQCTLGHDFLIIFRDKEMALAKFTRLWSSIGPDNCLETGLKILLGVYKNESK